MIKSGQLLKIAPGWNGDLFPFHLIHKDLNRYRNLWAIETTFLLSEDTPQLGGDRRLFRTSLGKATWAGDFITQAGLLAFLDFVNFVDLDCLVTIRTWNQRTFTDYNATMSYLPPADLHTNWCEVEGFLFTFSDLVAL